MGNGFGIFKSSDRGRTWISPTVPGPGRASIRAIAIAPDDSSTVFAGTTRGIIRSTDAGQSWIKVGLPKAGVYELVLDPMRPRTIYAGSGRGGVFKSTDRGEHWTPMNAGLGIYRVVRGLAIDPLKPSTIYVSALNSNEQKSATFKSVNGGRSWLPTRVHSQLRGDEYVSQLAVDPVRPTTIYAVASGGVLKSFDGGRTWRAVNNGLTR